MSKNRLRTAQRHNRNRKGKKPSKNERKKTYLYRGRVRGLDGACQCRLAMHNGGLSVDWGRNVLGSGSCGRRGRRGRVDDHGRVGARRVLRSCWSDDLRVRHDKNASPMMKHFTIPFFSVSYGHERPPLLCRLFCRGPRGRVHAFAARLRRRPRLEVWWTRREGCR